MNSRLDEVQAAVLRVKLRHLEQENARRRELARAYECLLAGTSLRLPQAQGKVEHVYHLYVVRSNDREQLREFLRENAIGTGIHYPLPVHLQPAYRSRIVLGSSGLPETEHACREILSVPLYPQLTDKQVRHVGERLAHWASL